jgi:rhodanese-related sulfurtransferase
MKEQITPGTRPFIDASILKAWLRDGGEIALLDVREHGQYGEGHPFFAVSLPYSRLELDAPRLLPRKSVRAVVFDAGDGVAMRAAQALSALGYTGVHILRGGVHAWREAGHTLFAGVNVPSKTFGELAEHVLHTPRIGAVDLERRRREGDKLVILDGRPYSEYSRMSIPGGICCPNGELALRVQEIVPDADTTIVVNCAGRTRSIIGAQTLIDLGLPNPVYALENGTQGWYLADLQLERGARRRYPDAIPEQDLPVLRARAGQVAQRHGVRTVTADQVRAWLSEGDRTTYLCDVRTPEEYAAGSLPGAQHTPGGQLIQATDQYIGVRRARVVLADDDLVRAPVVASWLVRMGWDAYVLNEGVRADVAAPSFEARIDAPPTIAASALASARDDGAVFIDVRPGMMYRKGHIAGARWSIRPRLHALGLSPSAQVVLLADDAAVAGLAARELAALGIPDIRLNREGLEAWRAAGLAVDGGDAVPSDEDCIDYLFFVHDRHDGNKDAARQYLDWETNLINQLDEQERSTFHFPAD